jgi:hypothetical protein
VIVDGRTFLQSQQIDDLFALARSLAETPRIIECVCADAVARQRLERDLAEGRHLARNRTFALYLSVKEKTQAIAVPHLAIDTGSTPLEECVSRCLAYLKEARP